VVCFSPRHDLTLPQMSQSEIESVLRTWSEQTQELGSLDFINYVQVFENKGAIMGCSNPHPHSQIWASAACRSSQPRSWQPNKATWSSMEAACCVTRWLQSARAGAHRGRE